MLGLYIRSKAVPPWVLCLLCLSKRLHSIYLLRLFNDGVAMLLAYVATWLLLSHRWRASLVAFSAAVSVKMNVLLMAPPVLLICLKASQQNAQPCTMRNLVHAIHSCKPASLPVLHESCSFAMPIR